MTARYLVRVDDVCPTLDWGAWAIFEEFLLESGIKPLVAVIPQNRNPEYFIGPADPDFWGRVRRWQSLGWSIGVHGFEHLRSNQRFVPGTGPECGEFAGLSAMDQRAKLSNALAIFERECVKPTAWVAPWHAFDKTTTDLLSEMGVRTISDGFSLLPYVDSQGLMWVPHQLWRFRRLPFGIWTVGLHYGDWKRGSFAYLKSRISEFRQQITSLDEVVQEYQGRRKSGWDRIAEFVWPWLLRAKLRSRAFLQRI